MVTQTCILTHRRLKQEGLELATILNYHDYHDHHAWP